MRIRCRCFSLTIVTAAAAAFLGCGGKEENRPEPDAGVDAGPEVEIVVITPGGEFFTPDNSIFTGVVVEEDRITLSAEAVVNEVIWVANSHEGSISKINTTTHVQEGRTYTGPAHTVTVVAPDPVTGLCPDGSAPVAGECRVALYQSDGNWSGPGQNPSRTSVDPFGNAFVANRAFSGIPSVTKIMNHCTPRGDTLVTWVPDSDADPANDPPPLPFLADTHGTTSPWDDTFEWEDDCIAWHTRAMLPELDRYDPGTPEVPGDDVALTQGQLGRGVVIQQREGEDGLFHTFGWLSAHNLRRYYEFDGETGELTGRIIEFPTCTPYGAAVDRYGTLWSACLSGVIGRAETRADLVVEDPADSLPDPTTPGTARHCLDPAGAEVDGVTCINGEDINLGQMSYGITVAPPLADEDPPVRVYAAYGTVSEYTPAWTNADDELVPAALTYFYTGVYFSAGVAVDQDGILWSYEDGGTLIRVNPTKVDIDPLTGARTPRADAVTLIPTGRGGRGVGVANDGAIWAINWGVGGDVTLVEPHPAPDLDGDLDPDGVTPSQYLAGSCCAEIENSYTYSDMTGYQLSNVMAPLGEFRFFVSPCDDGATTWGDIAVEGDFPADTTLTMHAKLVLGLEELAEEEGYEALLLEDGSPQIDGAHPEGGTFVMPPLDGTGALGLRVTLTTQDQSRVIRPAISEMSLERTCQ